MKRAIARWLNNQGSTTGDRGSRRAARVFYGVASWIDPSWSVPYYNLGLNAKYAGEWERSRAYNQRAVSLNPKDEDAWWNLGIAATALSDWPEARRAWKGFGIEIPEEEGEFMMPSGTACVRLDPNVAGEVVWGRRIDPARMLILNVPLPESKHRYHDVVLNDGAPNGTRMLKGTEVPVFDELMIWKPSDYSTFRVSIKVSTEAAHAALEALCEEKGIGIEDWSTVRFICSECSRGNPGPHDCKSPAPESGESTLGFAAKSKDELIDMLQNWAVQFAEGDYGEVELLLPAK